MVQKSFPITITLWMGAALAVLGSATIVLAGGEAAWTWLVPISGIVLVAVALVAKILGRVDV